MLDLQQLHGQFEDFNAYQAEEQVRLSRQLQRACAALEECDGCWERLGQRVREADPPWLVAELRESPAVIYPCGQRPTPVTVTATDGSQIFPDRHVEPTCYLLNISRIAFQYGTTEPPVMEARPRFHYRRGEVGDLFDELAASASAEVVSALRDEYELQELLNTARSVRLEERPTVAMADGTLIRWMLRGLRNRELEDRLVARYTKLLAAFREECIPLCSYISMPANTEVINLLRIHLGECEEPGPDETLEGLQDRRLYEQTLASGERSAVFESASHIQREYGPDRICYFYVHVDTPGGAEVGRVEMPAWVVEEGLLDLVHAVVVSECEKGEGYPMILSEAHEKAVIRAPEREVFYHLIEREMRSAGLSYTSSRKQAAKQRPKV